MIFLTRKRFSRDDNCLPNEKSDHPVETSRILTGKPSPGLENEIVVSKDLLSSRKGIFASGKIAVPWKTVFLLGKGVFLTGK
jgi:hypothetical protein